MGLLNGDGLEVDAQSVGQRAGVVAGALARIARRHGDPVHPVAPSASTATVATKDESIPPESPMTASEKPFLPR